MSKKISRVDKYNASADDIWAMLNSRDYVDAKYQALGDISTDVVQFDTGDAIALSVERVVPAELPDFAKKIMGDTNKIVQNENWSAAAGGGYVCDLHIEFPGKPLKVTGKLEVKPTGDATSDWVVNMEIKASVPLIGGKLEGVVEKETLASLDKEYSFNQEWLAG